MTMETYLIEIDNNEIGDHANFELVSSDNENNFCSINQQQSEGPQSLSPDGRYQSVQNQSICSTKELQLIYNQLNGTNLNL